MIAGKTPKSSPFRKVGLTLVFVSCLPFVATVHAQQLTTTEQGAVGGGLLGAGTGAIVGAAVHHPISGALIGAGIGAVGGGLVGNQLQQEQTTQHHLQAEVNADQHRIEEQRQEIQALKQETDSSSSTPSNQETE